MNSDGPATTPAERPDPYATIAPFYDLAMDGFDDDIDLYASLAQRLDAPVLECGAGTGRVARALASRGLTVTAIERSPAMLALAADAPATVLARVTFEVGDMKSPRASGPFGLIICALDTFLHLEDTAQQRRALIAWRNCLAPGGLIAIDLPGPSGDWGDWEPGSRPLVLDWSRFMGDARVTRFSSYRSDLAEQSRYVTDIFEVTTADGSVKRHTAEYTLRFVFPAEIELLLESAGLALHGRYGNYDLSPFDASSERLIVLAMREKGPGAGEGHRVDLRG